jgi:hypothetical protein
VLHVTYPPPDRFKGKVRHVAGASVQARTHHPMVDILMTTVDSVVADVPATGLAG